VEGEQAGIQADDRPLTYPSRTRRLGLQTACRPDASQPSLPHAPSHVFRAFIIWGEGGAHALAGWGLGLTASWGCMASGAQELERRGNDRA
jgi:hypothetical protein